MSFFLNYKQLLKKSPAVRTVTWAAVICIAIVLTAIIGRNVTKKPVISHIDPPVGAPGDMMVIEGSGFGNTRGTSFVEIADSKVTSSGYVSWSDTQIRIAIPSNVQDGLVVVGTSAGRSEPSFFANKTGIPVAVRADPFTTLPSITSVEPSSGVATGQVLTITGSNFGTTRGTSGVFFTSAAESQSSETASSSQQEGVFIQANPANFDYEFWSDNEIRVRVPDGAASGSIFVKTEKGVCENYKIMLNYPAGKKNFGSKRTYVVQITADISNNESGQDSPVALYMPRPPVSAMQPSAVLNDYYPEPLIKDDPYTIIHQRQLNHIINNKERFSQTFVIEVRRIESSIIPKNIRPYKNTDSALYVSATTPDECVQSGDEEVLALSDKIVGREKNPYTQAKLIYNFMIENYSINEKVRTGNVSALDLPKRKTGDAYDFAILFTALCRARGIPSIPMSGVIVESNSSAKTHWWSEVYFEDFGWMPVDPALGAGLEFKAFSSVKNPAEFYFGNMDNQHVAFSRGWHQIKPAFINGKTVFRPRTYALQSIWEEAGSTVSSYSSLWNNPAIIGIY